MPEIKEAPSYSPKALKLKLNREFRPRLQHRLSADLSDNLFTSHADDEMYERFLRGYGFAPEADEKSDFLEPGQSNVGWKAHLNVDPKNVRAVAAYLKSSGFRHKYLSGGKIPDGKIFTIYLGSFDAAKRFSGQISEAMRPHLSKPVEKTEIELAAGVVGRFTVYPDRDFDLYGTCGFSILTRDRLLQRIGTDKDKAIRKRVAEERAFKILMEHFGDYFFSEF